VDHRLLTDEMFASLKKVVDTLTLGWQGQLAPRLNHRKILSFPFKFEEPLCWPHLIRVDKAARLALWQSPAVCQVQSTDQRSRRGCRTRAVNELEQEVPRIAVVILIYKSYKNAAACVLAYEQQLGDRDILMCLDNTPESAGRATHGDVVFPMKALWFDARLKDGRNSGPAGGFALGASIARRAMAEVVVLSDQDFMPDAGLMSSLWEAHQQEPNAIISAISRDPFTGRRLPSVPGQRWRHGYLEQGLLPNSHELALSGGWRRAVVENAGPGRTVATPFTSPHGMLIPHAILEKVGVFSVELFIGFEDYEYCLRAGEADVDVRVALAATGEHHQDWSRSLSFWRLRLRVAAFSPARAAYTYRNTWWVAHRYIPNRRLRRRWLLRETAALFGWLLAGGAPVRLRLRACVMGLISGFVGRWSWRTHWYLLAKLEEMRDD